MQKTRRDKSRRVFVGAVVEGFEPPLAFTPNIISSDAPSAARTHHQLWKTIAHPQQEGKKNRVRQPGVALFTVPFTVPFSTPDTEVPATSADPTGLPNDGYTHLQLA